MFFLNDPTNIDELKNAITKFMSNGSVNRRQDMQKRIDFFQDKQLQYLKNILDDNFKYPDRMKLQPEFYNITKIVVNELAILYGNEPLRQIINGNQEDQEIYDKIVEKGNLNLILSTINKYAKLCKTVLIRLVWRDNQLCFDIITPNIFDVIQNKDDPTKADAILFINEINLNEDKKYNNYETTTLVDPFSKTNLVYNYWSKDRNIIFSIGIDKKIKIKEIDTNPNGLNPYGIIPFIVIRDGLPINSFFLEGGDDLINANEIINQKETELNYLTKMQSFSVPVRKGADEAAGEIILDPSMLLDIPADSDINKGSDFKFVSPDAKIKELSDEIQKKKKSIAVQYKIDPDIFTESAQKSSGLSLQIKAMRQSELIEQDRPYYRIYEQQLFEMIKIIFNYHSEDKKISENAELIVDFHEIEKPLTVQEEDEHNLLMFNNGLMSKINWIMKENPDIKTPEKAIDYLKQVEEENKMFQEKTTIENPFVNQEGNQNNNNEKYIT